MITHQQIRAARSYLGWTQDDLAQRSGVGLSTIRDFERGARDTMSRNVAAMEVALREAGIELRDDGWIGPARARRSAGEP